MLLYLFSAIAQTYGAILGVMGMFAVYRLQMLRDLRRGWRGTLLKLQWDSLSADNVETILKKLCEKYREGRPPEPYLKEMYDNSMPYVHLLKENLRTTKKIRNSFYLFLGIHLPIIVLSLIALIFVDFLKSFHWLSILVIVSTVLLISAIQIVAFSTSLLSGE
jgi:ABC-type multidrug transport system fused ATPase/permease subunit